MRDEDASSNEYLISIINYQLITNQFIFQIKKLRLINFNISLIFNKLKNN